MLGEGKTWGAELTKFDPPSPGISREKGRGMRAGFAIT
jgi:hypothetical protein